MEVRDATFEDLDRFIPIMEAVHKKSIFRDLDMNMAVVQRNFVIAMSFDDGYAKVVVKDGQVVGGLIGMIAENHFGIRCAQDLFNYSRHGTDLMLKDFILWSKVRGAQFVQITDMTHNGRYEKLCRLVNLQPAGVNYAKVM